jgi:putative FmdB family regulatory protein
MPIFEFRCNDCGRDFEALVRGQAEPACPQCGSHGLTKQLSVFATANSGAAAAEAAMAAGPCGSCGHPGGPGSCQFQ